MVVVVVELRGVAAVAAAAAAGVAAAGGVTGFRDTEGWPLKTILKGICSNISLRGGRSCKGLSKVFAGLLKFFWLYCCKGAP